MRNSFHGDCPGLVFLLSFCVERTIKDEINGLFLKGTLLWKRNREIIAISISNQHAKVSSHTNEHTGSKPLSHVLICQFYKNFRGSGSS